MDDQTSLPNTLPGRASEDSINDPEIQALLEFEPVPRKYIRDDGWSPALQRAFIRHLAESGSPGKACDALGKRRSGIDKLYKVAGADSFRAAWARAVEIAQERKAAAIEAEHAGIAAETPPFLDHRRKYQSPEQAMEQGEFDNDAGEEGEDSRVEMIGHIGIKFLKKVAAEREARLAGQIVAADFYLRQVTMLEVMFDLMVQRLGDNPMAMLRELRSGGHGLLQIADTPFARMLDERRREYWASAGEPMRPETFKEDYLRDHGDHRTQAEHHAYGPASEPAEGYTEEQWAALSYDAQRAARQEQFDRDAAAQVDWERGAYEEFRARARALREADEAHEAAKARGEA